jgi:hypothetical protein
MYAEAVFALLSQNIALAVDPFFLRVLGADEGVLQGKQNAAAATQRANEFLGAYVTLMAKLIEGPSRRLAYEVVKDWLKVSE